MGGLAGAVYLGASAYMFKWTVQYIVRERMRGCSLSEEIMDDTRRYTGAAASAAACVLLFLEGASEGLETIERFASGSK